MRALAVASIAASFAVLLAGPGVAFAQPEEDEEGDASTGDEDVEEDIEEDEEWEDDEEEEPSLRPPDVQNLQLGEGEDEEDGEEEEEEEEEEEGDDEEDDSLPSPGEAQDRLDRIGQGDGTDPTIARWSAPQTVFDLHGYIRFRGEFQDNFFFDRVVNENPGPANSVPVPGTVALPFGLFRPAEDGTRARGGCGGPDGDADLCNQNANAFANMRLRLEPTIHLSDDVRVRMQLDIFDNMVLGSTPNSFAVGPYQNPMNGIIDPYYRYDRTSIAPYDTTTTTLVPPQYGVNSLQSSISPRRAWAEVRNRTLGELRFGRMGSHWGLGILANGGSGIDSDYQTDVDRIMLITRLAGIYLFGAWDFTSEGLLYQEQADLGGLAFDRSRLDDTDQFVLGAAYRATEEEQQAALQRGDAVFNIGAYFVYRNQNLTSSGTTNPFNLCVVCSEAEREGRAYGTPTFVRRGADVYVPDIWVQFLYEKLRLELEAVMVLGTIDNLSNTSYRSGSQADANLLQFGVAFEGEYRLLNDQLGIYFNAGYASGDADQEGLSQVGGGLQPQLRTGRDGTVDHTYSTFYFHPNYRVDLIFWRNVMRQIGGAYYFRPGLSYDFIRTSFGQLLGARADLVWSRASEPVQAWGNTDDLGLELDVSVYYRSEDGPDILDGFYAAAYWGIFFPLNGINFLPGSPQGSARTTLPNGGGTVVDNDQDGLADLGNAMTFRLVLGVQY
ncbi:MAG: TIGR04551 family protein [Sandaracinaceae bacterium]